MIRGSYGRPRGSVVGPLIEGAATSLVKRRWEEPLPPNGKGKVARMQADRQFKRGWAEATNRYCNGRWEMIFQIGVLQRILSGRYTKGKPLAEITVGEKRPEKSAGTERRPDVEVRRGGGREKYTNVTHS